MYRTPLDKLRGLSKELHSLKELIMGKYFMNINTYFYYFRLVNKLFVTNNITILN